MTSLQEIRRLAAELSDEERELLGVELLAGVEPEPGYDEYWAAELKRRVGEIERGQARLVPWEDVRRQLWEGLETGRQA
jgi:putative addiction module component (TIGR02574 family)